MPLRVCVVSLNAYPAIDPQISGPIGGIETRSWMLARGLARQPDLEVSLIVRHGKPLLREQYAGVRLLLLRDRLYQRRESLALRLQRTTQFPWVKLSAPRWDDLYSLPLVAMERLCRGRLNPIAASPFYQKLPADLFLTFGVQGNSAHVIASAHASGRPAILFLGSDSDLDDRYLSDRNFVSAYQDSASVCRWTIQNADRILCQTESQQEKLKQFGREAMILRNPIDFETWDAGLQIPVPLRMTAGLQRYALWIGRSESVHKQPLRLIELARKCPAVEFLMILNRRDDFVEQEVRRMAPVNVRIVERVPFDSMPGIMRQAAVLVNTSALEGFPNTYLQAAASGVPIASLNVESKFLEESRAGMCAMGNLDVLAAFVNDCWQRREIHFDPLRARNFIQDHHALSAQSQRLAEFLQDVARDSTRLPKN